jgi:flagellar hook-associated protein 3 FlgL
MRFVPNIANDVIANIQQSDKNVQTALQEVSTGQRVSNPSDDPAAAAMLVQLQAETNNIDQYTTNAESALGQAQTADTAISSVVSLLNQAVTLGVEGANSTESSSDRQAIANSVQGLLSNVVSLANTTYQGVALFGGTVNGVTPFTPSSTSSNGYQYNGNSGISQVQVGDSLSVQINVPGNTLFDNPSASVLGALSGLATALTSGNTTAIGNATSAVTSALNYVTEQHVVYGSAINQLNAQESYLAQDKVTLSAQATSLVGIDTATAAEDLTSAEENNSAVLAASSKVLQNTLLNYLSTPS